MGNQKIPTLVPLPEVGRYTDDVVFGELSLPQGFDEEQLLVNLSAFNRTRFVAGLGRVTISCASGKSLDITPGINGVDDNGSATVGAAGNRERRPITNGKLRYPSTYSMFTKPDAAITIDSAVMD